MKTVLTASLFLLITSVISGGNAQAQNRCQSLKKRLERVENRLKDRRNKKRGTYQELKFQRNKLKSQLDKDCTKLDKKLENAFIKSSLISE